MKKLWNRIYFCYKILFCKGLATTSISPLKVVRSEIMDGYIVTMHFSILEENFACSNIYTRKHFKDLLEGSD